MFHKWIFALNSIKLQPVFMPHKCSMKSADSIDEGKYLLFYRQFHKHNIKHVENQYGKWQTILAKYIPEHDNMTVFQRNQIHDEDCQPFWLFSINFKSKSIDSRAYIGFTLILSIKFKEKLTFCWIPFHQSSISEIFVCIHKFRTH